MNFEGEKMKTKFEKGQYGLYYINSNEKMGIKLYAGVKILDNNGSYENSNSVYLLSINKEFLNKEVINVLDSYACDHLFVRPQKADKYAHNDVVMNWSDGEYVVGDFVTLLDGSCTLRQLLSNQLQINKGLKNFLKDKIKEENQVDMDL